MFNANTQQNKEEISKLKIEIENLESRPDTDENNTNILSIKITANNTRIEKLYSDIETFSIDIENSLTALQEILHGTIPMTSNLDMGNNRINAALPRNPQDSADYDRDLVTANFLYDCIKVADRQFLKANEADRKFLKTIYWKADKILNSTKLLDLLILLI